MPHMRRRRKIPPDHKRTHEEDPHMKGKIEAFQSTLNSKTQRYEVALIITVKKGLTYKRSEKLLDELRQEYMDKMVVITPAETE